MTNFAMQFADAAIIAAGGFTGVIGAGIIARTGYIRLRNHFIGKDVLLRNADGILSAADTYKKISSITNPRHIQTPDSIVMEGPAMVFISLKDKPVVRLNLYLEEHASLWQRCLNHLDDPKKVYEIANGDCSEIEELTKEIQGVHQSAKFRNNNSENTWSRVSTNTDGSAKAINDALRACVDALSHTRDAEYNLSGGLHVAVLHGNDSEKHILVKPTTDLERDYFEDAEHGNLALLGTSGNKVMKVLMAARKSIRENSEKIPQSKFGSFMNMVRAMD